MRLYSKRSKVGGQEKREDRKTGKNRSEEKVVGVTSASLFAAKEREAVSQGGIMGIDAEEEPGSRYRQRLEGQARPQVYFRYTKLKQEQH